MTAAGLAHLYGLMRPGEKFAALKVTVIDGRRTVRLVLVRGGVRRVVVEQDTTALCQAAALRQPIPTRLSACGRVGVSACTI